MYLKYLELQGFKSFPDRIRLNFDKGLTAVVGPNGSGKSNIGDSVRWVLGEQSTKNLRGNKMEDVIFSGTVGRKAMGFASVTLVIDNSEGRLEGYGEEVAVTRKLYRSGDSEYKINGKNVRLKDINELFMDTGLGRDGYSIIGQGRIAEIVGAKSNERREIFEEAAGISKFRYRKTEAERKLAQAQDNMERLHDIVSELEARVGPLKHQAEKAEKFVVLAQEQKTLEISVWVEQLAALQVRLQEIGDKLLVARNEYDAAEREIVAEEEKIAGCYALMQQCSADAEDARAKVKALRETAAQAKSDIAVWKNDIVHNEEALKLAQSRHAQELQEQNESRGDSGPFFCDYEAFKEFYDIQIRNLRRLGSTMFLSVIMVSGRDGGLSDFSRESAMAGLQEILRRNLRKGDIVTRFSPDMMAMLLPTVSYSTGGMVLERIENLFYDEYPSTKVIMHHRITTLGE